MQPLALATVLKTGSITSTGAPTNLADDLITYDLGLRIESTSPSNLFQAAALEGTNINLKIGNAAAAPAKRILVSDAIPVGTKLSSVSTALLQVGKLFIPPARTKTRSMQLWFGQQLHQQI